ncbi:class I SAM-dependent methyltransferase [Ascoidea rubescens DSM 1968]|uniref:S-adenosyl-L-methionine-dependent methyltransferase n=1 Tax=Ascoidea rubescens DSM 1968 TaxID=1344418 RepID=A0A1D2VC89_9ASCO|nr:S-adenosyl-L-methionine-dependent methyltransferase [Ascoidea rubescens DSM 1968]ODV59093.1 S-adenosyl-L-methionine-dependent methyltransferase [Ascoidea rubescens DSM 1968]
MIPTNSENHHQNAIEENKKHFNKDMVKLYDRHSIELSGAHYILTKLLLGFDPVNFHPKLDHSNDKDSESLGDRNLPVFGYSNKDFYVPDYENPKNSNLLFNPNKSFNVLDFACGTGLVSQLMVQNIGKNSKYVGIDISDDALELFNEKCKHLSESGYNIQSYNLDIVSENFDSSLVRENDFDVVLCTLGYHHFHDLDKVTHRLSTFLKKDGWLIIIDIHSKDLDSYKIEDFNKPKIEKQTSGSVQHIGGLPYNQIKNSFNLSGNLKNYKIYLSDSFWTYMHSGFMANHSPKHILEMLKNDLLESIKFDGSINYLIPQDYIVAAAQKV